MHIVGIVIFCSALVCLQTIYSDGTIDTTFGTSGFATGATCLLTSNIRIQADGKIVVSYIDEYNTSQIVRYLSTGSLDTGFNNAIRLIAPPGIVFDVLVQYNGQIVIGGQYVNSQTGTSYVQLARYNWNGSLDYNFGSAGFVTNSTVGYCTALAQDTSGKIIVAGTDNAGNVLLQRYTTAGAIDATFSAATVAGCARDVLIQQNGQIVIAGAHNADFILARYNTNGTLDTTGFGSSGIVTGPTGIANRILQQTNEYLIVGGSDFSGNIQMARYTTAGALDTTFNSPSGIVNGPSGVINDMALQANGSIVIAGQNSSQQKTLLMRYTSAGALDTSFGTVGAATIYTGYWNGMALQQNGYIILAGVDTTYSEIMLARFVNNQAFTSTQISSSVLSSTGVLGLYGQAQNVANVYLFINGVLQAGAATDSGQTSWHINAMLSEDGLYIGTAVSDYKNAKVVIAQAAPMRVSNA